MTSFSTYLLFLAAASAVVCALWGIRIRDARQAALGWVLGLAGGLIGSKMLYYIAKIDAVYFTGLAASLIDTDLECWSFFGGAAGAVLGLALCARLTGRRPMVLLNSFAPFGAAMIAAARFGIILLQEDMVGFGSYVSDPLPFLTVVNEWQEAYWAVFRMEALWAILAAVLALTAFRKRDAFLRTVFWLCIGQLFFESLHSDSIRWLFVRVEQLACMITAELILLRNALRAGKPCLRHFAPVITGLVCAGVFVAVEFALDKTDWPIPLIYGTMLAGIAAMAAAEAIGQRMIKPKA